MSLAFRLGIMRLQRANICCSIKAKCKLDVLCVYRLVMPNSAWIISKLTMISCRLLTQVFWEPFAFVSAFVIANCSLWHCLVMKRCRGLAFKHDQSYVNCFLFLSFGSQAGDCVSRCSNISLQKGFDHRLCPMCETHTVPVSARLLHNLIQSLPPTLAWEVLAVFRARSKWGKCVWWIFLKS